jgi:TIR domain-containing protein
MSTGSPSAGSPQRVFISYRREDSAAYAGRMADALSRRFDEKNIFIDVEMAPGVDFVAQINEVVSSCVALIVVIGPQWATIEGENGTPRLHEPGDFVCQEVTAAIQRDDVVVYPALVNKATMPKAEQLPEGMKSLARRNAVELTDARWHYDVGRLIETLDEQLDGYTGFGTQRPAEPATPPPTPVPQPAPTPQPSPAPAPAPGPPAAQLLIEGIVLAAITALLARLFADKIPQGAGEGGEIVGVVARRAVIWGLVGTVLGLWLGARVRRADIARAGMLGLLVGLLGGAIGGAIWALPTYLPAEDPGLEARENLEVVAVAVSGAFIGGLLGALWRRPAVVAGMASGLLAGALAQVILNSGGWNGTETSEVAFAFAFRAATITGVTVATMLLLSRRSSAPARAPAAR